LFTNPEKRIKPESLSQIRKMKGLVAWKVGAFIMALRSIKTAVAAAASVPSSLTSTKAKRRSNCIIIIIRNRNRDRERGRGRERERKGGKCGRPLWKTCPILKGCEEMPEKSAFVKATRKKVKKREITRRE
jgi:hypothetical protein